MTIASSGLPLLSGDPGAVEQANAIRIDCFIESNDILAQVRRDAQNGIVPKDSMERMIQASMKLRGQTQSSWWLSHRDAETRELLEELA